MARQLVMRNLLLTASLLLAQSVMAATPPASASVEPIIAKGSPCMPYAGESMSFDVGWEFVNAGSATLDIHPQEHGWQVKTVAQTNKMLDVFRKVRDYITAEGVCVDGHMQSTLFDANLLERKYSAEKRTEFIWRENRVAHIQGNVTEHFEVPAGHLSVIDAFLAVRNLKLKPGEVVRVPIFDSRKRYEIEVKVSKKKELIRAPWGEKIHCIIIEPKLLSEGIFTNKGRMQVWLSDDERHIPLRMTAKIKFGRIIATLTRYNRQSL